MRAWLGWLWQYLKWLYVEYKPKPRVRPDRPPSPPKPGPRVLREYVIPKEYTLQILRLFDNFRDAKGSAHVEKHLMWKRIQEILPIPSGSWQIDASNVTQVVIKEVMGEDK